MQGLVKKLRTRVIKYKLRAADQGRGRGPEKKPLTVSGCYNTNGRLFTYLNNKLFSHELKILNYDGFGENKKFSDENQRFDWIKSIH